MTISATGGVSGSGSVKPPSLTPPPTIEEGAVHPQSGNPSPKPVAEPRWKRFLATNLFGLTFGLSVLFLGAFLLVPILQTLAGGSIFGADWAEYLYTGPIYSSRGTALFEYPYPVLPILYLPVSLGLGHSTLASVYVSDVVSGLLEVAAFVAGYLAVQAYTRSRWTGLLGATLIGWFPLLQMEIGWGGQAQIVAYILGLLAVWVILEKAIPSLSVRPALAAGMLLLVAAFSEVYATAVIVLAVILLLVPVLWRRLLTWRGFETIIAILAPPAAVAAVLVFTDPAASNPAGGAALSSLWAYGPAYRQLWIALTYSNSLLGAIYIGALVMYVVYRVVFRARNPVETWLVPAMGVSALAIGALLTPVGNADRGLYPLVFPFAFAVAEMATIWPPGPVPDVPRARRRWRLSQEEVSWTFPVFVVATLAITGVQIGADFQIYPNALAYYTFDPGDLSELFWLANEPGAVLYDSAPTDHMFAVLWAMNRPIYPGPSFQPYTVTSQAKQDAVVLATALSYGENWIDDGQYIVTDAESGWGQPAPGILLVKDAHTFLSIESDDFLNVVSYSPGTNPSQTTTTNLYLCRLRRNFRGRWRAGHQLHASGIHPESNPGSLPRRNNLLELLVRLFDSHTPRRYALHHGLDPDPDHRSLGLHEHLLLQRNAAGKVCREPSPCDRPELHRKRTVHGIHDGEPVRCERSVWYFRVGVSPNPLDVATPDVLGGFRHHAWRGTAGPTDGSYGGGDPGIHGNSMGCPQPEPGTAHPAAIHGRPALRTL